MVLDITLSQVKFQPYKDFGATFAMSILMAMSKAVTQMDVSFFSGTPPTYYMYIYIGGFRFSFPPLKPPKKAYQLQKQSPNDEIIFQVFRQTWGPQPA